MTFFQKYKYYYKNNLRLAFPVMLTQIGQVSVQLTDNIMVGHFGKTELAASSFANSIFIIGFLLSVGVSLGVTPLVGTALGQKNFRHISSLFYHSLFVNIACNIIMFMVMMGVSYYMNSMGQPDNVANLAIPYFRIITYSFLPAALFFTFKQFAEGLGNTKLAMIAILISNAVNIGLNYVMIYGKLGCPAMGLDGAGYATLISRIFSVLFLVWFFLKKPDFTRYLKLFDFKNIHKKQVFHVFSTGLPIGLQMLAEVTLFSLSAIMVGWIDETSLAAHQIALSISTVSFMVATGICSATTIRVSYQLGEGRLVDMKNAGMASLHLTFVFMGCCSILVFLFREHIPYIFVGDENMDTIRQASKLLIFCAIYQIFDGSQVVLLGALRGVTDVKMAFVIALIAYTIVGVPVAYVMGFIADFGAEGIWTGLSLSLSIAAVLLFFRFRKIANHIIAEGGK